MDIVSTLAEELGLKPEAVSAAVGLIDEGNTIPFIARYRKEATGGMDDVALRALEERLGYLRNLEQRKRDVLLLIKVQGKLTPELEAEINDATQLQRVEDLYKPYRKKRQTRAQKAREAGLEPLANMMIMQVSPKGGALAAAEGYVNAEAGFDTAEKALAGARQAARPRGRGPDGRRGPPGRTLASPPGPLRALPGRGRSRRLQAPHGPLP